MTKTRITRGRLRMPMAHLGEPSRIPRFSWQQPIPPAADAADVGLSEEESCGGFRWGADSILPYRVTADYDRQPVERELGVIRIGNDRLSAEIAPTLGGRLWSLKDLRRGRDLVFENPVFQPANLGALDAWFSGGIEWNGLIPGHTPFTVSPVFSARVDSKRGSLVRLYEFDRIVEAFWQIDLYLPDDDDRLFVHGRIINPDPVAKQAYWWTNAAIPMREGLRVFSPADYAIEHVLPDNHLERFRFPDPARFDGSYPENWRDSTSVFFRRPNAARRYLAAIGRDGKGMFEVSTPELRGRKMFFFGTGPGGRKWMDHLSLPGKGQYIELQAGVMPTQNQRFSLPPEAELEWTEVFGALDVAPGAVGGDYSQAEQRVAQAVQQRVPPEELAEIDRFLREAARLPIAEIFTEGSPWGRRHLCLSGRNAPAGLDLSVSQAPGIWDAIAAGNAPGVGDPTAFDGDVVISARWEQALAITRQQAGNDWFHPLIDAIIAFDRNRHELALAAAEQSVAISPGWISWRMKALTAANDEETARAYRAAMSSNAAPPELADEIVLWLQEKGRMTELEAFIETLPESTKARETVRMARVALAIRQGRLDEAEALLSLPLVSIREGNITAVLLWRQMEEKRGGIPRPVPAHLDYRMKLADEEDV